MRRLFAPALAALLLAAVCAADAVAATVVVSTGVLNGTRDAAGRKLVKTSNGDLYSVRVGTDTITTKQHIYLSRSNDQGSTWVQVSTSPIVHDRDAQDQVQPSLAVDAADGLHLVWSGNCQGLVGCSDAGGAEAKVQYSSSPAGGTKWGRWRQIPANAYEGFEGDPQIIIDGNDVLHLIWSGQNNGTDYAIRYSSRSAQSAAFWVAFSTVMGPGTSPNSYHYPSLTIDTTGMLHVVAYGNNKQIHYSSKSVSVSSWTGVTQDISGYASAYDQREPVIAVDASNQLHVAWHGRDAGESDYQIKYAKRDTAGNWSAAANIQTISIAPQYSPSIAVTANGMVHVVWHGSDTISGVMNVKVSTNDGGGWGNYSNLTLAANDQTYPNFRWSPFRNNGGALDYVWTDNAVTPNSIVFSSNTSAAPPPDLPGGCVAGVAVNKSAGGAYYTTIQAGLNALPKSLGGNTCVFIMDNSVYSEQVTVQGFTTNGFRLLIGSDPNLATPPVVNPPAGSTAAFKIFNDSVTVQDFMVVATNTVTYGVLSSSAFVSFDRIGVDSNGKIFSAGISLSSFNVLSNSSVTVQNSTGVLLGYGTIGTSISFSTVIANAVTSKALYLVNASSNIVNQLFARNTGGFGVYLQAGSNFNSFSQSTMTSPSAGCNGGFVVDNSSWNTVDRSVVEGNLGGSDSGAVGFFSGSNRNTISSSRLSNDSGGCALMAFYPGSSSNTITGSILTNPGAHAAYMEGVANKVLFSTLTTNSVFVGNGAVVIGGTLNTVSDSVLNNISGAGVRAIPGGGGNSLVRSVATNSNSSFASVEFDAGTSSFTISSCTMDNGNGPAVHLITGSNYNAISNSTMNSNAAAVGALWIESSGTNTVTSSYMYNLAGHGALLSFGSSLNSISQSTITSGNSTYVGLFLSVNASSNTVTDTFIRNTDATAGGNAVRIVTNSNYNSISRSTMVASAASLGQGYRVLLSSANSVSFSYISGSTAVFIGQSTGTVINMNQIVATSAAGDAVHVTNGYHLTIASTSLRSPSTGRGLVLEYGNSGVFDLSTITFTGSGIGLLIANQGNITPAGSSMTFRGLGAGGTAIRFSATTPVVTTFTLVNFEDASIAVNVNAASLGAGARITMRSARGIRRGTAFETDPGGFVDWDLPDWCVDGATVKQSGGADFTGIQAAVDSLPKTLTGPTCIVFKDAVSETYLEQVTFRNFINNGSSITIMSDPLTGVRPLIAPPTNSTATFIIANASVNIQGLNIHVTNQTPYGIIASSGYVNISNVRITTDVSAGIYTAGVQLSTWSTLSFSTIVIGNAAGVVFASPAGHNTISFSTVIVNGNVSALDFNSTDSNTVTGSYLQNINGRGVNFPAGSDYNMIAQSTITTDSTGGGIYLAASATNTITGCLISNPKGDGLYIDNGSKYNTLALSSVTVDSFFVAVRVVNSDSNTVTASYIQNTSGRGMHFDTGADWNAVSLSTVISGGAGEVALYITSSDSNTMTDSYFQNLMNQAVLLQVNSNFNSISRSTMVGGNSFAGALNIDGSDWNRVSNCTMRNVTGIGALLGNGADHNDFSSSTFFSNGAGINPAAMRLVLSDSNTFTNSAFDNPGGKVVEIVTGSDNNTISMSTLTTANGGGWPALQVADSSGNLVTNSLVTTANSITISLLSGANLNTISLSTVTLTAGGAGVALSIVDGDSNTVTSSYFSSAFSHAVSLQTNADGNMISLSTMVSGGTTQDALFINASASNTVTSSLMRAPSGVGAMMAGGSHHNVITQSVMLSSGTFAEGGAGLYIFGSTNNTVSNSIMSDLNNHGAFLQNGGSNTISQSTMASATGAGRGLFIASSDANTITGSVIRNTSGDAAAIDTAHLNTISASTMIATGGSASLNLIAADSNTVTACYIENSGSRSVLLNSTSEGNVISQSTMVTNTGASPAVYLFGSALNTITGSSILNPGGGALWLQAGANYNTISQSTVIAGPGGPNAFALLLQTSLSNSVSGSYIQGSTTPVLIDNSNDTVFNSNGVMSTLAGANGVTVSASVNLFMSSNVITGGSSAAGIYLEAANTGTLILSTNTIRPGAQAGIYVKNPSATYALWITSNTILPVPSGAHDTYGIYLDGLTAGATIQNNSIYYRTPASAGGFTAYGLYFNSSVRLLIDHNRINNPGMVTGGAFVGANFISGGNASQFIFNDVHSSGTTLGSAFLLRAFTTPSLRHMNNIYSSSMVTVGSQFMVSFDAGSLSFVSDFNDYFSSNTSNNGNYGGAICQLGTGWTGGGCPTTPDLNSIAANPLWVNTAVGLEDFHPKSQEGRFTSGGFVPDSITSPTLDRADPGASFTAEPAPNGAQANLGSTGGTPEASLTFTIPIALAGPADGSFVSASTPTFSWTGTVPPSFRFKLATNVGLTALVVDTVTANSYFVSTVTLVHNTAYFWQVSNVGATGISPVYTFTVDLGSPTYSSVQVSTAIVGPFVSTGVFLSSNIVTARITVQDPNAGLVVSTGLPTGLVAQWHFDESSGTVIVDAGTSSLHGSYASGPVTPSRSSGTKGGLFFPDQTYAEVPHNTALDLQDLTIEMWIYPTLSSIGGWAGVDPNVALISKRTGAATPHPYLLKIVSGGRLCLESHHGVFRNVCTVGPVIQLQRWQHLAVTRTIIGGVVSETIYVNGVSTVTGGGPWGPASTNTEKLRIGQDSYFAGTTDRTYQGHMDEVRLYNVARSSAEILADYESDTLAAHNRSAAYNVLYSTNSGETWNYVSTANVTLSGANGTTGAQTLQASSIPFITSISSRTNLVQFVTSDMAGNVSTATYAVLVDTTSPNPPGCATVANVRQSGINASTGIVAALGTLPTTLTGPTCVVIRDSGNYSETVRVQGFNTAGNTLTIMADPALTTRPSLVPIVPGASPTGGFIIQNASVSLVNIDVNPGVAGLQYGVYSSSPNVSITSVNVINTAGFLLSNAGIAIVSGRDNAISYSTVAVAGGATLGLSLYGSTLTAVSYSSFSANGGGGASMAIVIDGGSTNTLTGVHALGVAGSGLQILNSARFNTITLSTISANGVNAALYFGNDGSSNTLSRNWIYNPSGIGAYLVGNSNSNLITLSTVTSAGGSNALTIDGSSMNTVSRCLINPLVNSAIGFYAAAKYNTIMYSTMIVSGAGVVAVNVSNGSSNTISSSYVESGAGSAVFLDFGATYNTISQSTIVSNSALAARSALEFNGAAWNLVTGSFIQNPAGHAAVLHTGSSFNTITLSTMVSAAPTATPDRYALHVVNSASNTISASYIQGSTAAYVSGSTGTTLSGNVIVSTNNGGSGVTVGDGSFGAVLSLNTISAGLQAQGIQFDVNNTGGLIVSTNTILPGSRYGIFVSSQTPGAAVWITSNTVLPQQSSARSTAGIWLFGLTSGATIQNNAVYYRQSGGTGVFFTFAVYLQKSSWLVIDHNRLNQPGVITGGNYGGVVASNTSNVIFKFNDIHDVGTYDQTRLMSLDTDSNYWTVESNIFMSSVPAGVGVGITTATIDVDVGSAVGFASDYNNFFSSNGLLGFRLSGFYASSLAAWVSATGRDANSIGAHPLWASTTPGAEDFHPLSQAGRFPGFAGDTNTSPTIDAADPAEGVGAETTVNGGVANQGSYGLTNEASRTPASPGSPLIAAVGASSITVTFTAVGADGYIVQAAPAPDFAGAVSSAAVPGSAGPLAPQGLSINTTYYLRAGAVWGGLTKYALTTPASTATLTDIPTLAGAAVTGVSTGSLTYNWLNNNPAGTAYDARVSTASNFTGNVISTLTYNFFFTTTTLAPNTTFYLSVSAVNQNGVRSAAAVTSTITLPSTPGSAAGAAFNSVNALSITVNWSSGTAVGGYNPSITAYRVALSSDGFITTLVSPSTTGLAYQFTSLVPNTTYQASVAAVGHATTFSSALPLGTTNTIAARPNLFLVQPGPAAGKDTSYGEFTDTAGLPNDPALKFGGFGEFHHGYIEFDLTGAPSAAQALSADLKLVRTATTGNDPLLELRRVTSAWTESGINSVTQPADAFESAYGFVLPGVNTTDITGLYRAWQTTTNNGLKLHSTDNSPDTSGSFASSDYLDATLRPRLEVVYSNNNFAFLTNTSIIVQWSSGSATAGYNPSPTGYQVQASTDNFATLVNSVGTYSLSNTFAGLTPNTTFQMRVRSFSGQGEPTDYSTLGSTSTLASAPVTVASTFSAVEASSFTVSWGRNNNPLSVTSYTVVFSTDPFPNSNPANLTFTTAPAAGPSYSVNGLAAFTVYYFGVSAINHNGLSSAFTSLGSTRTLPISFTPPVFAGYSGVFNSSVTATWGLVAGATGYTVLASTETLNPPVTVWASTTVFGGATTSGTPDSAPLAANTTFFFFARVNGGGASSAYAAFPATSTLASMPTILAFPTITANTILSTWTTGVPANPNGTLYELQMSTAPNFTGSVTSSATLNVFVSSSGLSPNTTYFFQVRAINNNNMPSAFSGTTSTATLAVAPATAVTTFPVIGQTSMTVTWLSGGNPLNVTSYTVVLSTDNFYPNANPGNAYIASTMPAGSPLTATFVAGTLNPDTTYYLFVAAINHENIPSAYTALGSTKTLFSVLFPAILDNQGGDAFFRKTNSGFYNVDFADSSGAQLTKFQVKASTSPNGTGTDLVAFTDVITGIAADSYTTDWALPPAVFTALYEGVTNYITVKVFNGLGNSTTNQDVFFVQKDTTAPTLNNFQAGDNTVRSAAGTLYDVDAVDMASKLSNFQYSASALKLSGDQSVIPWTDIAVVTNSTGLATDWAVNFAALGSGPTNYISVRAWDQAGTTTTIVDAFYILKDTVGPTVGLTAPAGAFVSALSAISGTAASYYPLKGTEVSVQQTPPAGPYWDGSAFISGTPVFFAATGGTSWTYAPGITFVNGTSYQVVARSSNTANLYSSTYATATFTFDQSTPTVAVTLPVPSSTISSLPAISGTAADPAYNSGLSAIEVRLRRNADGLWWNWFTETWSGVQVSSVVGTASPWGLAPSSVLQANLDDGASYFIAVRASDNATPPNAGDFLLQGATFTFTDTTSPAGSTVTAVAGTAPGSIDLTWNATGDDGNTGTILLGEYRIWYSTDSADAFSTTTAQIAFSTGMVVPGAAQSYTMTALTPGVTYYVRLFLEDGDGNWSSFSNQASTISAPSPSNSIIGHVVNASTQGITAVQIDCWNAAGALVSTVFTVADGSGTYTVTGLVGGNYKIQASWTANGITSSVWQDAIAMGSYGVDFTLEINYALATLTGTLGTLGTAGAGGYGGTGYGVAGVGALGSNYFTASHIELFQGGHQVGQVGVSENGRWTIAGLLPGTYQVRAFTAGGYTEFITVELQEGEIHVVGFVFDPLPDAKVFAFPNPARNSTTIRFESSLFPLESQVMIFDLAGNLVREIPGSQITSPSAGTYHAAWDLTNMRGENVASGVYLFMVKVRGGSDSQNAKVTKKIAVVR